MPHRTLCINILVIAWAVLWTSGFNFNERASTNKQSMVKCDQNRTTVSRYCEVHSSGMSVTVHAQFICLESGDNLFYIGVANMIFCCLLPILTGSTYHIMYKQTPVVSDILFQLPQPNWTACLWIIKCVCVSVCVLVHVCPLSGRSKRVEWDIVSPCSLLPFNGAVGLCMSICVSIPCGCSTHPSELHNFQNHVIHPTLTVRA